MPFRVTLQFSDRDMCRAIVLADLIDTIETADPVEVLSVEREDLGVLEQVPRLVRSFGTNSCRGCHYVCDADDPNGRMCPKRSNGTLVCGETEDGIVRTGVWQWRM